MLSQHLKHYQVPTAYLLLNVLLLTVFPSSWCRLTLVTTTYPPFSDCSTYHQSPESSSVFGAEVNLIRSALNSLNWTEGIDYAFECVSGSHELKSRFRKPKSDDLGMFGGIAISHSRLQRGLSFSQPTLSASVPLVHRKLNKPWFFIRSFTLITWGLVFLTVFAVGGVLYLMEDRKSEWIYMLYNVALQFFFAPDFPMSRFTSKLIQLFSLFLATVLVYIFTALSTNIFESDRGTEAINSLSDLSEFSIVTNKMLGEYMSQYNSQLVVIEPKDIADPVGIYDFDYLLLDGPYANYLIRQHCELSIVFQQIDTINYGVVFTSHTQKEIQAQISKGILEAKEKRTFYAYTEDYYSAKTNMIQCNDKHRLVTDKVTLHDARSLWYIYFAGLGIGIIMMMINYLKGRVKKNLQMYVLKGVRAKRDKTVQRRMATSVAMYAGISLQAIEFLKRMSQEAIHAYMIGSKISLPVTVLELTHRELHKKMSDKETLENASADQSENLGAGKSEIFRKSFMAKIKRHLSLRINGENETKRTGRLPAKTLHRLKSTGTRRSSFLQQSMQSYQLAKTFTSKNILFSDQSLGVDADVNSVEPPKKPIVSEGLKETKKAKKSVPLWQKLFGKKGIKVNKSMIITATNLLQRKESLLIEELNRKKSEVSNMTSFSTTSLARVRTLGSTTPKNISRQPSAFKVKFLEDKGFRSRDEDLSDADSSEFSGAEDLRQSIVSLEGTSSRTQAPLASAFQRYKLQRKERSKRRMSRRQFEEEFDYEAQSEHGVGLPPSSSRRFSSYDFSKMVKMKTNEKEFAET